MDIQLLDLWMPILIGSVACFLASSVLWMVLPHHKPDIKPLPDEHAFTAAITPLDLQPGYYMYPNCQEGETMNSEEFKARWKSGPWGSINILSKQPSFAKNMVVNFAEMLVVATITAYLASMAMGSEANTTDIVQFTFTCAFLGFVVSGWAGAAFLGTSLRFVLTSAFDGLVYAALTACAFALFWPAVQTAAEAVPAVGG